MIKGIGIDIIEIERIKEAIEKYGDSFLGKIFTRRELTYCRIRKAIKYPELAVRFAAKEAYAKAIGKGIKGMGRDGQGVGWKEIEVINDPRGKPNLAIKGKTNHKIHVSLSHSRDYALASVFVEK